jgi:hypothetical protein
VGIALTRLRESGCQITTSESALFQLMGSFFFFLFLFPLFRFRLSINGGTTDGRNEIVDSKHPNFRAISALVKESKAATTEALNLLVVGSGGKL